MESIKPPSDVTTESGSKASEKPHPGDKMDTVIEKPAAKTREEAAKALKEREKDPIGDCGG